MQSYNDDIHYQILKTIKSRVQNLEKSTSPLLKKYRANQRKLSQRTFEQSSEDELMAAVEQADITYLGDFHTFDQNQRNLLRILKGLIKTKESIIVGLEMVDYIYSEKINAYLNEYITELEFLESIDYHDSWRFPWNHYKLIFDLAKKNKFKIIGLNSKGDLHQRDQFAANLLAEHFRSKPNSPIIVLFGEYHIAPNKMPQFTHKLIGNDQLKQVIVHQNLEEVYFAQRAKQQSNPVVKYNDSEFCITTSPPWVKYESQLYWFENLNDDPDFDLHEYLIEHGNKIFSDSSQDNFLELIAEIIRILKLEISVEKFKDFNLKDHTQLNYIEGYIKEHYSKKVQDFLQNLIISGSSFHLPGSNTFYCSNYSLNRLSYLAGTFIFHHFLREENIDEKKILEKENNTKIFIYFTLKRMVSYYVSKIINPHRKCNLYLDFKEGTNKSEHKVIELLANIEQIPELLKGLGMKNVFPIAESFGHMLGEYLFHLSFIDNQNDLITFKNILLNKKLDLPSFTHIVQEILGDLNYRDHKKRLF